MTVMITLVKDTYALQNPGAWAFDYNSTIHDKRTESIDAVEKRLLQTQSHEEAVLQDCATDAWNSTTVTLENNPHCLDGTWKNQTKQHTPWAAIDQQHKMPASLPVQFSRLRVMRVQRFHSQQRTSNSQQMTANK